METADNGSMDPTRIRPDRLRFAMPALAAAVAALTLSELPWSPTETGLLAAALAGFLAWSVSDRAPVAPLALLTLAVVLTLKRDGQFDAALFLMSLVAATAVAWSPARIDLGFALAVVIATPLLVTARDPGDIEWEIWLMGVLLPALLGWLFRRQTELVRELANARQELVARDREEERRRVARDVHDVVARGLAVMLVQVSSARHVLRRDAAEAEHALVNAEMAGRESLAELRAMIEALRQPTETALGSPTGELARAALDARARGLDARLSIDGDPARIRPETGTTLVRVAQEALVNAAKHAPDACTHLSLTLGERTVTLDVRSCGAGRADRARAHGYGLLGMRERADAAGGTLVAGPDAGDWLVRCTLPLQDVPDRVTVRGGAAVAG